VKIIAPLRESDSYGSGHFGASRGNRKHNGKDYACYPKSKILSPVEGKVTKIGYPYGDDPSFRYVQITTKEGYNVRVFYVEQIVFVGSLVNQDDVIGLSQKLGDRYPADKDHPLGITDHIHLEIKDLQGKYVNPDYLNL